MSRHRIFKLFNYILCTMLCEQNVTKKMKASIINISRKWLHEIPEVLNWTKVWVTGGPVNGIIIIQKLPTDFCYMRPGMIMHQEGSALNQHKIRQ